jgi:hypothetical protein
LRCRWTVAAARLAIRCDSSAAHDPLRSHLDEGASAVRTMAEVDNPAGRQTRPERRCDTSAVAPAQQRSFSGCGAVRTQFVMAALSIQERACGYSSTRSGLQSDNEGAVRIRGLLENCSSWFSCNPQATHSRQCSCCPIALSSILLLRLVARCPKT